MGLVGDIAHHHGYLAGGQGFDLVEADGFQGDIGFGEARVVQQRGQADVGGAEQAGQPDALAAQIRGLVHLRVRGRDDGHGELLPPGHDIDHGQALVAGHEHLFARGYGKGDLARGDQAHAVGLETVVELDVEAGLTKVAAFHGHIEGRVLDVGNVAHRQADGLDRPGRGGRVGGRGGPAAGREGQQQQHEGEASDATRTKTRQMGHGVASLTKDDARGPGPVTTAWPLRRCQVSKRFSA